MRQGKEKERKQQKGQEPVRRDAARRARMEATTKKHKENRARRREKGLTGLSKRDHDEWRRSRKQAAKMLQGTA